jgi:hypothetical protein
VQTEQKARIKTGKKAKERQTDRQKDKKGHNKVQQHQKARTKTGRKAKESRQTGRRTSRDISMCRRIRRRE